MKLTRFAVLAGIALFTLVGAAQASPLACYIDTPAYDQFTSPSCFAMGTSTSVAVFRVNVDPNYWFIYWSEPSCSNNSTYCVVSISPGQQKTVTAQLLFGPEPEGYFTYSATAYYEGPW